MKHVWILNHYAEEPSGTGGIRHFGIADNLMEHGWTATVIAASVEHATGKQKLKGLALRKLSQIANVGWLLLRTPVYKGNGIGRIINMLVYTILVLLPGMTRGLPKPDVIIGSSVHPFAAWAGKILAHRHKVPFVFEVRDLWPTTLVDMGRLSPDGTITKLLYRLERRLAHQASLILVLLPKAMEYYHALGVSENRIALLPNGAYVSTEEPSPPPERNRFVLMYCGAMGQANALETLIDSLKEVESRWEGPNEFDCRIVGDGPMRDVLENRAKSLGLNNVNFEMQVPKDQVSKLLEEADAFVITLKNLPDLYRFGISMNKIFDYMSAGRPTIMAADVPENPIQLSQGGVIVSPESPVELAGAIIKMMKMDRTERYAMGKKAWVYALENHHYRNLAMGLASNLNNLVVEDLKG